MQFIFDSVLRKICGIFLILAFFMNLWNIDIFNLPVVILSGFVAVYVIYRGDNTFSYISIFLFVLLLYEYINYHFSLYQPNSILCLGDYFIVMCCGLLLKFIIAKRSYIYYIVVFVSLLAALLGLLNVLFFFYKYYELTIYGFYDFSQFRALYFPLGFLSNEWVTISLLLLPFPILSYLLSREKYYKYQFNILHKPFIQYLFIFVAIVLVFNILISFSRAGILAILLFVLLLNFFFLYYPICKKKKVLYINIFILFSILSFVSFFSSSVKSSFEQTNLHQRSTEGRFKQWHQCMVLVEKYPYCGIGSNNYPLLSSSIKQIDCEDAFTGRLNNTYIQLLVEKGLIGTILWLSILGFVIFYMYIQIHNEQHKLRKAIKSVIFTTIIAVLFREMFFSSIFYNPSILFLLLLLFMMFWKYNIKQFRVFKIPKIIIYLFYLLIIIIVIHTHYNRPENALNYATQGLNLEREVVDECSYSNFYKYLVSDIISSSDTIKAAIKFYERSCEINPYDASFYHNLGWLYWINSEKELALLSFSKALNLDPNNALYYITVGLVNEADNRNIAYEAYKCALLLSPDIIDSPFYEELRTRNTINNDSLLHSVYNELLSIQRLKQSTIISAKMGKILLSLNEEDKAHEILVDVTNIHPNLSRPWYYIGNILYKNNKKMDDVLRNFRISSFLSPNDHLPLFALASCYKNIGNIKNYDSYLKSAYWALQNKHSTHSIRSKRTYFVTTKRDDVIPKGLLDYITPKFK